MATNGKFQLIINGCTEECITIATQVINEFPGLSIEEIHQKLINKKVLEPLLKLFDNYTVYEKE